MRKVNLSEVPVNTRRSPTGRYESERRPVSVALGAHENEDRRHPFEVELNTIPPGARFCPYHQHTAEWEFYLVLSGRGEVRHPGGTEPIGPGDSFIFPPNEPHQISNPGGEPLVYYVIANDVPSDSCFYPDSNKWAVGSPDGPVLRNTPADYLEGEE